MDEGPIREALLRHWRFEGIDYDRSHEIYRDDAILEFPQSGERFVGMDNFLTWRRTYPGKLDFRVRRLTHDGDLWVAENLISYDDGPWQFTVSIIRMQDGQIAHERIYVMEGFSAAEWRSPWATLFDPLEAVTPADWRSEPTDVPPPPLRDEDGPPL